MCPTGTPGMGVPPAARGGRGGFRGGFGGYGAVTTNRAATCYKCGGPNHYARDCQAQAMKCYACGKLVSRQSATQCLTDVPRVTYPATARPLMEALSMPPVRRVTSVASPVISARTAHRPRRLVRAPMLCPQDLTLMAPQLQQMLGTLQPFLLPLWPSKTTAAELRRVSLSHFLEF
jgi:hypothetical protein